MTSMKELSELRTTEVDLAGLMRVLGNNLYSTPTVAVRELVQNAHDSCIRRRLEAKDDFEPSISVGVDPAQGVLTIEDTGAGLTQEEIVRYLATLGSSYTGELRDRYDDAELNERRAFHQFVNDSISDRLRRATQ